MPHEQGPASGVSDLKGGGEVKGGVGGVAGEEAAGVRGEGWAGRAATSRLDVALPPDAARRGSYLASGEPPSRRLIAPPTAVYFNAAIISAASAAPNFWVNWSRTGCVISRSLTTSASGRLVTSIPSLSSFCSASAP